MCKNCQNKNTYDNTTIIIDNNQSENLIKLNNMLNNYVQNKFKYCKNCHTNETMITTDLKQHLIIETDFLIDKCEMSYKIIYIPNEILVMNTR